MKVKKVVLYARFSPRPLEAICPGCKKPVKVRAEDVKAKTPCPECGTPLENHTCDSIEKQVDRIRSWCHAMGYEIAAEYTDEDLSGGTTDGRTGFENAIKHACKIRGVLAAYDLSRLTRDVGDASAILKRLEKRRVELILIVERIDTTTPIGKCMYHVLAAFAQLYREQAAARTSFAMKKHQANGRRMGRPDRIPFGFRASLSDPGAIEPDDAEQAAIAEIKALGNAGEAPRGICRVLDQRGILRRGKTWKTAHGLVAKILARQ